MGKGRGGEKGRTRGGPGYLKKNSGYQDRRRPRPGLRPADAPHLRRGGGRWAARRPWGRPGQPVERRCPAPALFFFQAEDGIRDWSVTGVQTCALPISGGGRGDRGIADRRRVGREFYG